MARSEAGSPGVEPCDRGFRVRVLPVVSLNKEQLPLLADNEAGVFVVRGAAGSGKTTTALMRLRQLCQSRLTRRAREGAKSPGHPQPPVRVLVLTFNRTLEGYIRALAEHQVAQAEGLDLRVTTFASWAVSLIPGGYTVDAVRADSLLQSLCGRLPGSTKFLMDEVRYVLGRFAYDDLESYLRARREGRGGSPRMEEPARRRLLDEVIYPFLAAKAKAKIADWNDLAVAAVSASPTDTWDVIVVDETQDFSANELRAILAHTNDETSVTFIIDAAQQIYKKGFSWKDVGVDNPQVRSLKGNYRNTREIAALARPLVDGLPVGVDGTLPNLNATVRSGARPVIVRGKYAAQVAWAIKNVVGTADLANQSVGFLVFGEGAVSRTLKGALTAAGVDWVELTSQREWPRGSEAVAVSTLHSAKGLEFDHVVILGISDFVTQHGTEADDTDLEGWRRLLAMGIGRASQTVTLGYKPGEESKLISFLDPSTFDAVSV